MPFTPPTSDFSLGSTLDPNHLTYPRATEIQNGVRCFSGTDINVYIFIPFVKKYNKLGSLKLLSWGTQRTKAMVTELGRASGVGYTRGARVVTGVLQFLQLDRSAFTPIVNSDYKKKIDHPYRNVSLPDELPPFDLLLCYVSENGSVSYREIGHVEIVASQGTDSIDDANPVEVYSFVALEITALLPVTKSRSRLADPDNTDTFTITGITPAGVGVPQYYPRTTETLSLDSDVFLEANNGIKIKNPLSSLTQVIPPGN